MRRGEILTLRWDQVDWDGNVIRLEKKQTKGKKARVAPLYGELRAWLEMAYAARVEGCPFIVAWKGHGISEVKTAWQKARVRAGVPELLVHDLRRTAARNMIRAGVPERQVLDIVGWKTRACSTATTSSTSGMRTRQARRWPATSRRRHGWQRNGKRSKRSECRWKKFAQKFAQRMMSMRRTRRRKYC
ncbi:MAG: site-specific integrase [Bryobacteraceae bacterium]